MDENLEFHIKISYFEIYLDKIRDLLDGIVLLFQSNDTDTIASLVFLNVFVAVTWVNRIALSGLGAFNELF